jgi:hypothetical protein
MSILMRQQELFYHRTVGQCKISLIVGIYFMNRNEQNRREYIIGIVSIYTEQSLDYG